MINTPATTGFFENRSGRLSLAWVFVAALLIRWAYALAVFAAMGAPGLMGVDSESYLGQSQVFAAALTRDAVAGWEWFGSTAFIMPLFHWLLTVNVLLFGSSAPLSFVLLQGIMDAGTCVLVARLAGELNPRWTAPAAVVAAINPTLVVMAGMLYTDTLFLLFTAVFLMASVRWLKQPTYTAAALIGIGLSGALLTRVLIAPWAIALLAFLPLAMALRRRLGRKQFAQIAVAGAIFGACIGSLLISNAVRFGAWALSAQTGIHMSFWVVPLVKEARDGTPWRQGYEAMWKKARDRFGPEPDDLFERSRQYQALAREELAQFTVFDFTKAWMVGAAVNLGAPGIILSPPVSRLPRTGFYETAGSNFFEKVGNFLFRSGSALYAWVLAAGLAGVVIVRLIQLAGAVELVRQRTPFAVLALLGGWCVYILLVNGPVGSPKYRLPMEPVLVLLTAAGLDRIQDNRKGRRSSADH